MQHSDRPAFPLENLTFWQGKTSFVCLQSALVTTVSSPTGIAECQISASIHLVQYEQIERDEPFNLNAALYDNDAERSWQSDRPLQIQLALKPDLFPHLCDRVPNPEDLPNYLQQCNTEALQQGHSIDPLLQQENWYCLSVKQTQDTGEVGYDTLWKYLNFATLDDPEMAGDAVADGIANFLQDAIEPNLAAITNEMTANFFQELTQGFMDGFRSPDGTEDDSDVSLFSQLLLFFEREDWSFTRSQGETALRLTFSGSSTSWECYARVREEHKQILFYSICPIVAPEDRRAAAIEFVTRANYNLTVGNFEINFDNGEIHYKTSIDVEGNASVTKLIQQLVRANVSIMDRHLPGIAATIEQGMAAKEAIALVEGRPATPSEPSSPPRSPQTSSKPVSQGSGSDSRSREDNRVRPPMKEAPPQFKGFQASLARELVEENSPPASENEREGKPVEESRDRQEVSTHDRGGEINEPAAEPQQQPPAPPERADIAATAVVAEASEERIASESDAAAENERRVQVKSTVSHFMASQQKRQERIAAIGQTVRSRLQAAANGAREALTAAMDRNRNAIPHSMAGAWDRVRSDAAAAKEHMTAQYESTVAEIQAASARVRERADSKDRDRFSQKMHDTEQKTVELAARTLDEQLQSIDVSLRSTMASLDKIQTVQLQLLETVGKQQEAGMDAKVERIAAALQERVVSATIGLEEVRGPIATATDPMAAAEAEIERDLETGIVDSEQSFLRDGQQAIAGLNAIGRQAFDRGNSIVSESETSIGQIVRGATTAFVQMQENHSSAMEELIRQASTEFK